MPPLALTTAALAVLVVVLVLAVPGTGREATADEARRTALTWVGAELADRPRRDGDRWEVDVRRPDGSLVEVTLGERLELTELDEERGPAGAPSHDEVDGPLRARAISAARRVSGPGRVRSVEREADGSLEVDVLQGSGVLLEVELDPRLRVVDTDLEDPGDE